MDYSWLPSRKGISKRDFMHWHCAQQRSVGYVYKPTVTWHQHQWFSLLSKAPLAFCKMMRTIILPNEHRKKWTKRSKTKISYFSSRSMKITEKVSFYIASEASYVYILNGQKFMKNTIFWSLRSNSVTRQQVTFNRTKIDGKDQNPNTTFGAIFK